MALGGGIFTTQNKTLPGAYLNFVSLSSANPALSDRGIATMPLELDWGLENTVFEVSATDFQKNSLKLFGYSYNHDKMKGLRDLFLNTNTLYAYRLNGNGIKASNDLATAKFSGVRGNNLKIVVKKNVEDETLFNVETVLGASIIDTQTVETSASLVDNDFVTFNKSATLEATPGIALSGGTNAEVTGAEHQNYLDKIESYSFNALGVVTVEETVKNLYVAFTKRLRNDLGVKFQSVVYNKSADFEGVINVKNKVTDEDYSEASLVYWVTGIIAGCAVNASNLNRKYDGEFTVNTDYTQTELVKSIQDGEFILHKVGADIRVLEDVNSLVTTSEEKGEIFKDNQTVRVIDQLANDTAVLFNDKYLGKAPNDEAGRSSFWSDLVKQREEMQRIRAIENFSDKDVVVERGESKKSVVVTDTIEVINSMAKLYMTTTVG